MWEDRPVQDYKYGRDEDLRPERRRQAEGKEAQEREVIEARTTARPGGFATTVFMLCLFFIGVTSCLDGLMVVKYRTTPSEEQNPVGSFLIQTTGQEGFFVVKMAGTMTVILLILFLFKKWLQAAYLVVAVVTAFQLLLMYYIFS